MEQNQLESLEVAVLFQLITLIIASVLANRLAFYVTLKQKFIKMTRIRNMTMAMGAQMNQLLSQVY